MIIKKIRNCLYVCTISVNGYYLDKITLVRVGLCSKYHQNCEEKRTFNGRIVFLLLRKKTYIPSNDSCKYKTVSKYF